MIEEIKQELLRLEAKHDIKILYAVESGSRAWGFASADSDWDVRYIYIHRLDWYLQIDEHRDNQNEILPNDIDLAGWELKKALRLFRKSNPPMLEWLNSPIVYLEQNSTAEKLRELVKTYFNPKACLYHYLSMAESNYKGYLQNDMVRLKKYFYVIRPLLACEWIMNANSMAPVEFRILLDTQLTDQSVKNEVEKLLIRKMAGDELKEEPRIPILHDYIDHKMEFFRNYVQSIGKYEQPDTLHLNRLFQDTLNEAWS